ncbi:hypothetical protein EHM69_08880 [candidate division KSB1 bacterium]|nr:MAG: hypothetical protein EHM69_08880 [candidate division KSB1 bacterium]
MNKGFVKLPRSLKDHPLLNQTRRLGRFEAYIDLLDRASFHVSTVYIKKQEIILKPGDLLCSLATLARTWGWHRTTVHDFLSDLKTAGLADILIEKGLTRITVHPEADDFREDNFPEGQNGNVSVSGAYNLNSEATSPGPPRSKKKEGKKEESLNFLRRV